MSQSTPETPKQISQTTRQDLSDVMLIKKLNWGGDFGNNELLSRLRKRKIPILKDWDDFWQDYDDQNSYEDPFQIMLMDSDDEILLCFLAETAHPVVRTDITEAYRLVRLYNGLLMRNGFALVKDRDILEGKPVFIGQKIEAADVPGISRALEALGDLGSGDVYRQIARMDKAVHDAPELAIGTAKELIETCCKTILSKRGILTNNKDDLPQLVKKTAKKLKLTRDDISDEARAVKTIKNLLSNLTAVSNGIAELRNEYGTGHGRIAGTRGLSPRHAKLVVGAASALAVFLVETHEEDLDRQISLGTGKD